jgi:predicted Zn finger-like uncharacterized protein
VDVVIVECPRCRARYRVESGLLEEDQTFKCSRCSHIFAYEAESSLATQAVRAPESRPPQVDVPERAREEARPTAQVPPPPTPSRNDPPIVVRREDVPPPSASSPGPDESLSFSFSGHDEDSEDAEHEPETPSVPAFVAQRSTATESHEFAFGEDDEDDRFALRNDENKRSSVGAQPRFMRGEDELRIQEEESTNPTRAYVAFLAVLVLAYAVLALDLLNHPARTEKLLASVPLVGDTIAQDQLLQIKVHLEDVEGAYQQIKDDRAVFIISGRAVNSSNEPLKGVQIESALYDPSGKQVEAKNIYCGNAMSLKIVKDLSSKEISLLQRLEPPKRFEIRPGESAGWSVVFLAPPTGIKEFTARVVSAQASLS